MINPLATDWPIKQRSEICNATHRPFTPGEVFYTLLYREGDGFRREDLSEEAWRDRNENIQPFSFWKTKFEPAPPPAPEALPKENAEQLFRRLITQPEIPANACFVLAVMVASARTKIVLENRWTLSDLSRDHPSRQLHFKVRRAKAIASAIG